MSDRRIHQARAALARAEQQWKIQVSCLSGGIDGVIARGFGGVPLANHISIGGIAPVGLHEVICGHDDCAASLLAWYLAHLDEPGHHPAQKPIFWVRQRRALDQGGFYALSTPHGVSGHETSDRDMSGSGLSNSDRPGGDMLVGDTAADAVHLGHACHSGHRPHPLMMVADQQMTALWTGEEVAKSGQVRSIIIETTDYDLTTARRLQLACEAGGTRMIILRPASRQGRLPPSSAWTRWQITPTAKPTESENVNSENITTRADQNDPTGNHHYLSLIGGRGVRPGSWKVKTDAATFSLSMADPLEKRLSDDQHIHA